MYFLSVVGVPCFQAYFGVTPDVTTMGKVSRFSLSRGPKPLDPEGGSMCHALICGFLSPDRRFERVGWYLVHSSKIFVVCVTCVLWPLVSIFSPRVSAIGLMRWGGEVEFFIPV